jgi:hypothetical protein
LQLIAPNQENPLIVLMNKRRDALEPLEKWEECMLANIQKTARMVGGRIIVCVVWSATPTHWEEEMKEEYNFYDRPYRPYRQDKQMVAAYAEFFQSVGWQLFATFTFGSQQSDERADWLFKQFINLLERMIHANIIFIRGDEKRFSGTGKPACSRHFHVLLTSAAPLDPFFVECLWKDIAGHRDDGADVRLYDPGLKGAQYVFKMMNQPYGEWTARNLHLVFATDQQKAGRRARRNLRRHEHRVELMANTKPVTCTPWTDCSQGVPSNDCTGF